MIQCGESDQNINHILWQCRLFDSQRTKFVNQLKLQKLQLPLHVDMLISKPNVTMCEYITTYLKKCNLTI